MDIDKFKRQAEQAQVEKKKSMFSYLKEAAKNSKQTDLLLFVVAIAGVIVFE